MDLYKIIANELGISAKQVETVINLFNEEATIPFIARYRKEHTGGLDEDYLREIEDRYNYLTLLDARKETVLKSIAEQGKLTDDLKLQITNCTKLQEVEDLYLPYRPKRKTRATIAKSKGLEPLAQFILDNPKFSGDFNEKLNEFVDEEKGVKSENEALQGAKDIISEMISDSAEVRKVVRETLSEEAIVESKRLENADKAITARTKDVYEVYHDFQINIKQLKPYQILAINRGEKEKFLKVSFGFEKDYLLGLIYNKYFDINKSTFEEILRESTADGFDRLIYPSIEREMRKVLTEQADLHAIEIFASNLRQLLLQPPIAGKMIMGIDPGFVSGSKIAVIDPTGKYIEGKTIYPHPPQKKIAEAKKIIADFVKKYDVELIAIGNGTASRETEMMVADLIKNEKLNCHYLIVNEAGASVYSASPLAKDEFPDLEASMRGNISIARRVLDPLAELVKIDSKSIGVGLYQHDVDQSLLNKKLGDVVVSCVNYVGVDLNTASYTLLSYVSGLTKRSAKAIEKFRKQKGKFQSREQLMSVSGVGEKAFEQSAGFLKISDGDNPLDNTSIHPESYDATNKLLDECNVSAFEINSKGALVELYVKNKGIERVADKIGVGVPTLKDILSNLKKPGRDPREEMPKPILRSDVLKMDDLQEGMVLKGTVRNVVDFGAFVDIGVKQDGLIHISQMGKRFVKNPLEILSVGDVIDVSILKVDIDKGRIGLSLENKN